ARRSRPAFDQGVRNVVVAIMRALLGPLHGERLSKRRPPLSLGRIALLRAEHTVLVEIGPLAVIAGIFELSVERPPRLRSPAAAAPETHHDVTAAKPGVVQLVRTIEDTAVAGAQPQLLQLAVGQTTRVNVAPNGCARHAQPPSSTSETKSAAPWT